MPQTPAMRVEMATNFAMMYANAVETRVIRLITNGVSRYVHAATRDNPRFNRDLWLAALWCELTDDRHFTPSFAELSVIREHLNEFFRWDPVAGRTASPVYAPTAATHTF